MGAITLTLVKAGRNRMQYLLSAATTGTDTGTITTTGAATPDIITDLGTNGGPLLAIAKAFTNGYGPYAAGALAQDQARQLWLADNSGVLADGKPACTAPVPVAMCQITPESGTGKWQIDANVSSGHPTLNLQSVGGGTALLDIFIPGTIGA